MDADGAAAPQAPGSGHADVMARCKPLRDPVRALSIFFIVSTFGVTSLVGIVTLVRALSAPDSDPALAVLITISSVLIGIIPGMSFVLLLKMGRRRAVLVRKFKNDIEGAELQRLISAGLGANCRLCGIRSPVKRVSFGLRLVFWTHAALIYVGSPFQQLEAEDNDWLARILKTLKKTDFAVIDMRNATDFVLIEAQTCVAALGVGRCIFIVDEEPETVKVCRGFPFRPGERGALQVLMPPRAEDEKERLVQTIASWTASPPDKPDDGHERALAIVRTRTAERDFRTRFIATDLGQFLLSLLVGWVIGFIVTAPFHSAIASNVWMLAITLAMLVLFVSAWRRLWRASAVSVPSAAIYRRTLRRRLRRSAFAGGGSLLVSMFLVVVLLPALNRSRQVAMAVQEGARLKQIGMGLIMYDNNHPGRRRRTASGESVGIYPAQADFVAAIASATDLPPEVIRNDVWGRPHVYMLDQDGRFILYSVGPDGAANTKDDICLRDDTSVYTGAYENGR